MVDFSHLNKLEVSDKTAEYVMNQIEGQPTLIVKPATESNKPYFNSVLRRSRKTLQQSQGGLSAKMITDNRNEDKELYPKHVIVGWEDMKDSSGELVDFSVENCTNFIGKLPPWLFDEIRTFCGKSINFCDEATIDIEEKLGN
jgi:hypothetical protein